MRSTKNVQEYLEKKNDDYKVLQTVQEILAAPISDLDTDETKQQDRGIKRLCSEYLMIQFTKNKLKYI